MKKRVISFALVLCFLMSLVTVLAPTKAEAAAPPALASGTNATTPHAAWNSATAPTAAQNFWELINGIPAGNAYARYPFPQHDVYTIPAGMPTAVGTQTGLSATAAQTAMDNTILTNFLNILKNDVFIDTGASSGATPQTDVNKFQLAFYHLSDDHKGNLSLTVSETHGYCTLELALMAGCEQWLKSNGYTFYGNCTNLQQYYNAALRTYIWNRSVSGTTVVASNGTSYPNPIAGWYTNISNANYTGSGRASRQSHLMSWVVSPLTLLTSGNTAAGRGV
ncbi:MAG: hypothetical protein FWC62_02290, partial [Firmicutes bacterium]|nr:hypothetical protein [Bacillota bacterium]